MEVNEGDPRLPESGGRKNERIYRLHLRAHQSGNARSSQDRLFDQNRRLSAPRPPPPVRPILSPSPIRAAFPCPSK